uniref:Uncharacterized protein n=1 Tax=Leptobrachium leishanense TaxID=445787 RepID=A0A8C5Q181_9ANUR
MSAFGALHLQHKPSAVVENLAIWEGVRYHLIRSLKAVSLVHVAIEHVLVSVKIFSVVPNPGPQGPLTGQILQITMGKSRLNPAITEQQIITPVLCFRYLANLAC